MLRGEFQPLVKFEPLLETSLAFVPLGFQSFKLIDPAVSDDTPTMTPVAWLVVISGMLEGWGILLYVRTPCNTIRDMAPADQRPALLAVKPYFGMMLTGWILYASFNVALLVQMGIHQSTRLDLALNQLAIQCFVGLVLLHVRSVIGTRNMHKMSRDHHAR